MKQLIHAACLIALACSAHAAGKPNILFIAIDDLRPELGCYGSDIAVSPNLDSLAASGLLFQRAYCQQAICRPSRASLMTGARPDSTGLYHNYVALRELQPDIVTLPQHFIAHGYETVYCGKVFHHGDTDEENSWSRSPVKWIKGVKRPIGPYALPENNEIKKQAMQRMLAKYGEAARRGLGSGPAYECADVPGMRETWFGPLIEEVERRIIKQQGDKWNREMFENHLMGYTMRTDRYRLVIWQDQRDRKAEPIFVELYDHQTDPHETTNIAGSHPEIVRALGKQLELGWKKAL